MLTVPYLPPQIKDKEEKYKGNRQSLKREIGGKKYKKEIKKTRQ